MVPEEPTIAVSITTMKFLPAIRIQALHPRLVPREALPMR